MINLSEVTIEYAEVVPTNRQIAEFYCTGGWYEMATITKGDRTLHVGVNGEMHLEIPEIQGSELIDSYNPIRYGNELLELFNNDSEFYQLLKTVSNSGFEMYRMNPWWEVFSDVDPDGYVSDEGNFYDVIDQAIALLDDEDYWKEEV